MKNEKAFLASLSTRPGVYRMLNDKGVIIYVGKAKNIKKRVQSYFNKVTQHPKTAALMDHVNDIEITLVNSENDALLLEANLIKKYKPRYNVLMRDDKSYPYLFLSSHDAYPRLDFFRGEKKKKGRYFGPYPSAGAVRKNLARIQKLFKLRQCSDSFFSNRSRPCLQYQIKRCSAPCVGYASDAEYQNQVQLAVMFLEGKNQKLLDYVTQQMKQVAAKQEYEKAAEFRDIIAEIRVIQKQQHIVSSNGNIDIVAVVPSGHVFAVAVVFIRAGHMIGHKTYFPKVPPHLAAAEVLAAFLSQYYLSPWRESLALDQIILNQKIEGKDWIASVLKQHWSKTVKLSDTKHVAYRSWLDIAEANAKHDLAALDDNHQHALSQLTLLQKELALPNAIEKIECFDISHTQGEHTVASCVVYGTGGPIKKDYRQFNIKDITPGDDYAAMKQVITRRYKQLKEKGLSLPDVLLIDGGLGQLKQAVEVFESLQVSGVELIGVAKGRSRKPGMETLWRHGASSPIELASDSPALHLIQFIRDESHRFAITKHRKKRAKARTTSVLESIAGVGVKRRQALLNYFGGLQSLKKASAYEIAQVPGINDKLAQLIFDGLHS